MRCLSLKPSDIQINFCVAGSDSDEQAVSGNPSTPFARRESLPDRMRADARVIHERGQGYAILRAEVVL